MFRPALLSLLCLGLFALPAAAQEAGATKVGVVNTARVFNEMAETKDLANKMAGERDAYLQKDKEKQAELAGLKGARDNLKPSSADYREAEQKYIEAGVRYKAWQETMQLDVQRRQKQQIKSLFEKIEAAVAEVAKQKGIGLVISQQKPELPETDKMESVSLEELRARINQRNVLFAIPQIDLSDEILAVLDRNFQSKK